MLKLPQNEIQKELDLSLKYLHLMNQIKALLKDALVIKIQIKSLEDEKLCREAGI